ALASVSLAGAGLIRRPAPIIFPVLALMLATGWGIRQVHTVREGPVVMAAVQPHVPQAQKFDPALAADHMRALQRLVGDGGRRGADLIVLPETALPLNLFGPGGALVEVGRWAHQARATIIASSREAGRPGPLGRSCSRDRLADGVPLGRPGAGDPVTASVRRAHLTHRTRGCADVLRQPG